MRKTRFTGLRFATGLVLVTVTLTTGCKTGGWAGSSWAWNPMKSFGWGSSPPAASSLASATKPSTQVPTPGPQGSVAARGTGTSSPTVPSVTTPGYGGATAPSSAMASYPTGGYPTTNTVNGYPNQPATAYGTPGQPGQVAPTAGYNTGNYGMTASPAGGATGAQQGPYPTYTANAQSGGYQPQPYSTPGYQAPPTQPNYSTPAYNTQPAGDAGGYNNGYNTQAGGGAWNGYQSNPAYNSPPASAYPPGSQPAAQPSASGYMQGGYNTSSNNSSPMPWQNPEANAAANSYASAPPSGPYDTSNASNNHATGTGEYATSYNTPTAPAEGPRSGNLEVTGVTTGTPATNLPASLNSPGGYRPGSTGRPLDPGVQNAGYQQPTGYNNPGGTFYR